MNFAARRQRLRPLLAERGLDALLVAYPANRFYLSGFALHDGQCNESSGCLLIREDGRDVLFTDPRYEGEALHCWDAANLVIYKGADLPALPRLIAGQLRPGEALGVDLRVTSAAFCQDLALAARVVPASGLVEELRIIKEPEELAAMRRSAALNHAVFAQVPSLLTPGKTERVLAWELEKLFREGGASQLAFSTIVAVDANAALPHAIPGETPLPEQGMVLVDMGCRLDDYCSDQTRTFWMGGAPSPRFAEMLERVQAAQATAMAMMRPGVTMKEAYQAARSHFESLGVADHFTHGLGHGIGLETHEPPSLNPRAEAPLRPGMVVTVEPGLYWPGWGGARWEYMVVVTEDGVERL